ncbi:hypothetical protein [Eubacterium aggregans]|uniref:hypothetical protein n=1 Tax=Eubacterium aggregans TaxID=81409 RepID=UPI001A9A621A|nr:hypothetical protein [Eubacterium aggregans]
MNNELLNPNEVAFNEAGIKAFADLVKLTESKKVIDKQIDEVKSSLETLMKEHGIKSIDNEFIKITSVPSVTSKTVDLKAFKAAEPVDYEDLVMDYPKVTTRKGYVRFTVK